MAKTLMITELEAKMKDKLYTLPELADELRVSKQTAYNWLSAGKFPNHLKVGAGQMVLVPSSDVEVVRQEEADKLVAQLEGLGFQAIFA